jgi:hypothetical protein
MCFLDEIISDQINLIIARVNLSGLDENTIEGFIQDLSSNFVVFEREYSADLGCDILMVYTFSDTEDLTINVLFEDYNIHPNKITYFDTDGYQLSDDKDDEDEDEDYYH